MAFDGIVVASLAAELNKNLLNGRLAKIAQPENDELLFTIKTFNGQFRLAISANPSLPLIYITNNNKPSPITAPNFCMLLRKHISNGRITKIYQPGLERIINFEIEHYNELGDLCKKVLIVELMGKHSNIIFCDNNENIIDSIKHVTSAMSSVRQVIPGRKYFIPDTMNKYNPLDVSHSQISTILSEQCINVSKAIYTSFTGISPIVAEEICFRASIDSSLPANTLNENELLHVSKTFETVINDIKSGDFYPAIYSMNSQPKDFSAIRLSIYDDYEHSKYDSISCLLCAYFEKKNAITRINQKSADLRKIVTTILERDIKKYDLQMRQLKDTEKMQKFKTYGDLLTTYGYSIKQGTDKFDTIDYYTNNEITIPLDATLTPIENAKKYFDKYSKLKRTRDALTSIIKDTKESIDYMESISVALDMASTEDDLKEIKSELVSSGYIRKRSSDKKSRFKSEPLHYISSDGFDIYVGKNNIQNEYLTFKLANNGDWWFHSKTFPGSHVIVKSNNDELPDKTFEEAAKLAAFYSKGKNQDKVEIDYVQKKYVKKVPGAKPGFVIYHTNYSMSIAPDINNIKQI
ncbi:MAG: NFACT family protein [Eubacterium sp.]